SDKEYLKQFNQKVVQQRIPLSGSFDLTHQCNLRCVHCYLGDKTSIRENSRKELSADQWISVIDDITEAGCLFLLITGGEPLLRKDFAEIYRHAKKNGLLVTVFTNGTLISDRILELFEDFPPHAVEISLYGARAETYEKIAGVTGSFEKCLKGVERLLDLQINVTLKTILMTLNRHEFYDIENMAKAYGVKFRFDAAIFPSFDGDKKPMSLRVDPAEVVQKEFSDKERLGQWRDYFVRMQDLSFSEELYDCGAGLTTFHIDPFGYMKPCLMVQSLRCELSPGSFLTCWNDVMPRIRERVIDRDHSCVRCERRTLCGFCPAFSQLENGAEDIFSEYLCAMGQHRFQEIQRKIEQEC
ncbi:MAG: radical SAM protein, partial [Deltaproteobacteria bacterium]|nr:radical SAM protein [Deltaproteobacteria bacterium]